MRVTNERRAIRAGARLLGCAALWALASGNAWAQTGNAENLPATTPQTAEGSGAPDTADAGDDIVVTGFRASLNAALDEKREAVGVVDVIKAEDIADFPDNNLAESIQRIPGVTINRDQGEGRNISVRGLGPVFTRVRINGIEGMSTTGGSDSSGGANRGRQFDFNTFASELFNSITVRKTASADVEEGSLGATVDLTTARPFDYKDDITIAGTASVGLNDFSNSVDPKLSAIFAGKFLDGRLGVLVSAAYSERGIFEEGPSTVRWERGTDNGGFAPASTLPTGAQQGFAFFHPRIPRYDSYRYKTKRLGLTGSIQFAPTDATEIGLDVLYSKFKSDRSEQYLEAISFSRSGAGKPQTVILPGAVVDDTNSLVSGRFNNVDVRVESRFDRLSTEFQQYTGYVKQEFGDALRLDVVGGYSTSDFKNPIQTTVALDANNVQGYSFDFTQGRNPVFNYGSLNVANPASFTLGEIRLRPQFVQNDFRVGRATLEWDANDELKVRVGGDYKKYKFASQELRRASETAVPTLTPAQLAAVSTLYSISAGTQVNGTPRTFVVPALDAFADALGIYSNTGTYALTGITNSNAQGNIRTVTEEDLGAFGQLVWNIDLGGLRFRGDAGVRYVETRQASSGYTGGAAGLLVTDDRKYDNWLPSLNVSLDLDNGVILRGGLARVMTRPNLGTLNPTGAFSISGGNRTYTIGNPDVDPITATTYDLSAEWYFSREGALVVGLFMKDIDSFIANTAQSIPFNQLGLPTSLITGPGGQLLIQPTDLITVTQPVNSSGGKLKGFEVGFQTPFSFLPGWLSNFGIQANYTYVKSNIRYPLSTAVGAPVVIRQLTDLSRHSANATLYYEDDRFSIRGSLAYRSGYLQAGGVPGRNGVAVGAGPVFNPNAGQPTFNDVEGVHGTINIDASASLKITENVSLTVEAINLTDQYVDQYIDSAGDRLSVYHHTGRQFYFGARFKF
jgi:iron complex outermembrane recepter protein